MRITDKNTATATVAGLLLGFVITPLLFWNMLFSAIGFTCLGAFAIARSTQSVAATAISTSLAPNLALELISYVAGDPGSRNRLIFILIVLLIRSLSFFPIMLLPAWLGARAGGRRDAAHPYPSPGGRLQFGPLLIQDKSAAIATIAGLLLGFGMTVCFVWLTWIWSPSLDYPATVTCFTSGVMGIGAFAIAVRTKRFAATVVAINMAVVCTVELAGYLLGMVKTSEGIAYALLFYFLTGLPLTVFLAWLGARVSRWQNAM